LTPALHITADDYGLHADINSAVVRLLETGALTDTSAMGNGRAIERGAELLHATGRSSVGLHLCWVGGEQALGPMPILAPQSRLPERPQLIQRTLRDPRAARNELFAEGMRQARALQALGLHITHIDSHQHMHVLPSAHLVVLEIARRLGGAPVRLPRVITPLGRPIGLLLTMFSRQLARVAARMGIPTYLSFGFEDSGRQNGESLRSYLMHPLPPGSELMTHPGDSTPVLRRDYGSWRYDWSGEAAGLEEVTPWRESHGITVGNFG